MNYVLTPHAQHVLAERKIPFEWVERALSQPTLILPSITDPVVESRFAVIPEYGGRVLRVVVNKETSPERVVSVYFDRSMKGKL
jgi:uncharacterized DUF497 family protein